MEEQRKQEIAASLDKAAQEGLFVVVPIRTPVKVRKDSPKLAIAVPFGDKDDPDLFVCPKCSHRHFGVVRCEKCGEDHSACRKLHVAGLTSVEWLLHMWNQVPPLLCSMQMFARKSILSAQARNEMDYEILKQDFKYIYHIDDDVFMPPTALYEMHNVMERTPDAAVLSAVYTTKEELVEPEIYKLHGEGAYWNFSTKPGVIEPIFGAGGGALMVRVEALREIEKCLPGDFWADVHELEFDSTGRMKTLWGHDIRFCKRFYEAWQMDDHPNGIGPMGVADPKKAANVSQQWKVYVAGWIQCVHYDYKTQRSYFLPSDAPCFTDANRPAYWDSLWNQEGFGSNRRYPELFSAICEMIPEGSKVLDFGCGVGILMEMLTKKRGCRVFGADLSPRAIKILSDRWLDGVAIDAIDLPKNGDGHIGPYDPEETVFVSTETLEHLDYKRSHAMLSYASRYKEVVLSFPNGTVEGTPSGEHVREFDEESAVEFLSRYFNRVEVYEPVGGRLIARCSGAKPQEAEAPVQEASDEGACLVQADDDNTGSDNSGG